MFDYSLLHFSMTLSYFPLPFLEIVWPTAAAASHLTKHHANDVSEAKPTKMRKMSMCEGIARQAALQCATAFSFFSSDYLTVCLLLVYVCQANWHVYKFLLPRLFSS